MAMLVDRSVIVEHGKSVWVDQKKQKQPEVNESQWWEDFPKVGVNKQSYVYRIPNGS